MQVECQSARTSLVIRDLPVFGVDLAAGAGFYARLIRRKREGGAKGCGKAAAELITTCRLTPHVTGVQTPRDRRVSRAFDDGSAVREERHLKRLFPELQHEGIVTHAAVGLQALTHFAEVDRAIVLVNLHRVPPTQGNVRTAFCGEIRKFPSPTGAAVR